MGAVASPEKPAGEPVKNASSNQPTQFAAEKSEAAAPPPPAANQKSTMTIDLLVGKVLDKRYRIDALIGNGAMGKVFRATRLNLKDTVAIKVLHPDCTGNQQSVERFSREAETSAKLKHPNAVGVYDFGTTEDGLCYLVMDFVEGSTLRDVIRERGVLLLSDAIAITTQIAAALDEAHGLGIVHRDLKPDNIIVQMRTNGLRAKVLDFGIAKLCDTDGGNLTQAGFIVGTPRYMSPEQILCEGLDARSDVYSLGIIVYEMLTGTVPFNSPSPEALFSQHTGQLPTPLRSHNLTVPTSVESVVLRSLSKRRETRQQTAGQLANELQAASGTPPEPDDPTKVIPAFTPFISASTSITPRSQTPGAMVGLLIILTILLLGTIGYLAYPAIRDSMAKKGAPLPDHFGVFHAKENDLTELRMREYKNALKGRDELKDDSSSPNVEPTPTFFIYSDANTIPSSDIKLIKIDSIKDDGKIEHWDYQISPVEGKPEVKQIKVKGGLPKGKFAVALFKGDLDEGTHRFWSFQVENGAGTPAASQTIALNLKPTPPPQSKIDAPKTAVPGMQTSPATPPPSLPSGPIARSSDNNVVVRSLDTKSSRAVDGLNAGDQVVILGESSRYETHLVRGRPVTSNYVHVYTIKRGRRGYVFKPYLY